MSSTPDEFLQFYRTQSEVTDPKEHAHLYAALPEPVEDLCKTLQNILFHNWKIYAEGIDLSAERRAEIEIRPIARLLARIQEVDGQPWDIKRAVDRRVVVDCRHFATLLCSILRHRNIPARTRHGFASYLVEGHRQSHVVCEYWDFAGDRWVTVDADTVRHDMPAGQFITADAAWRGVSSGALDPQQFGYAPDVRGAWCVRWEVVRDFAALNKREMLTFDIWGINASNAHDAALSSDDAALLDQITALLSDERRQFPTLRSIYETDARLRVPPVIRSEPYTTGRKHLIDLRSDGSMAV
jgi:hypothetical protein